MTITAIAIDSREPDWVKALNFGAPTVVSTLSAGDAWVTTKENRLIVIERKTPSDFLESIKDGRLFNQASKMRQLTSWCYVVITGPFHPLENGKVALYGGDWRETGWEYSAVEGAKLTLAELGVFCIHCAGDADYAPCIGRLACRSKDAVPILPVRETTLFGGGETVLASLPGIGPTLATRLMQTFGSAAYALWYLTDPSWNNEKRVKGINSTTKQNIIRTLGGSLIVNIENGDSK